MRLWTREMADCAFDQDARMIRLQRFELFALQYRTYSTPSVDRVDHDAFLLKWDAFAWPVRMASHSSLQLDKYTPATSGVAEGTTNQLFELFRNPVGNLPMANILGLALHATLNYSYCNVKCSPPNYQMHKCYLHHKQLTFDSTNLYNSRHIVS